MHVPGACLQVREARHDDVHIELGAVDGRLDEVSQIAASVLQGPVQPQSRVCSHLSAQVITCPYTLYQYPRIL